MVRRRGSIAFLMNSLSSGSSSSRSVCGDGTLTSSISKVLQCSRDNFASRSFLMSAVSIPQTFLCGFGAAMAESLFRGRPYDQHEAEHENRRRKRPQQKDRIIMIGNLQRLMERTFR